MSKLNLRPVMAVLASVFMTACATNSEAINQAGAEAAAASQVGQAILVAERPPQPAPEKLPADCHAKETIGTSPNERLDVALTRADDALSRQIARTERCVDLADQRIVILSGGPK